MPVTRAQIMYVIALVGLALTVALAVAGAPADLWVLVLTTETLGLLLAAVFAPHRPHRARGGRDAH